MGKVNQLQFRKGDVEYARKLLDMLRDQGHNEDSIAQATGISRRNLFYIRKRGFRSFPSQVAVEIMAGLR